MTIRFGLRRSVQTAGVALGLLLSLAVEPSAGSQSFSPAPAASSRLVASPDRSTSRAAPLNASGTQPSLAVSVSDNRALAFTVTVDSIARRASAARPEYSLVSFDQGISVSGPGEPDVPCRRVVIGIPPTGTISVTAQGSREERLEDIQVMPVLSWHDDQPIWNFSATYQQDDFHPSELVKVERIGLVRGVRCASLLIAPVQYNPARRECRVYHQIDVQVKFSEPARTAFSPGAQPPAPWNDIYRSLLPNGDLAGAWAVLPDTHSARNFFDRSTVWYRVKVETTGIYKVSYADLQKAGANPELIDPRTLQLFTLGDHVINSAQDSMNEVPLLVVGQSDSIWGKQGYLAFSARGGSDWDDRFTQFHRNLYTRYNYYWLTWGAAPGLRMASSSRPPNGATPVTEAGLRSQREEDLICPGRAGLLWLWAEIDKSAEQDSASADFDLKLKQPVGLTQLTMRFMSVDPDPLLYRGNVTNHLQIYINGTLLDSVRFGVRGPSSPLILTYDSISLARIPVNDDSNILRVVLVRDDSLRTIFFDYADLQYRKRLSLKSGELEFILPGGGPSEPLIADAAQSPILLDISNSAAPVNVTGFMYQNHTLRLGHPGGDSTVYLAALPDHLRSPLELVRRTPGHLKSDAAAVDYVIVAPDGMYEVAQLLQRYRTGNVPGIPNARVMTARLSEIYDEFSFGLEEPGAIKAFLALRRPSYALLVGDATYDYRDNFAQHPAPGVPPYEIGEDLDPNVYSNNARAIDAWYADWDDGYDTPDLILARITVRSPEEFRHYYDKVVAYEHGQFGLWNRRLLLLADDELLGDWNGDNRDPLATEHIPDCEAIGRLAGSRMDDVKIYETEYPLVNVRDKPGVRSELIHQLGDGVLLWAFFGHGAGFQLTHEHALNIEDVPAVHDGRKLPFCFFGSCGVGRWEDTRTECIAEELARKDDGAIATCGATKGTSPSSNLGFCQLMMTSIFGHDSSLGRAFYTASFMGDKLYHLFGEPGLTIQVPRQDLPALVTPETLCTGSPLSYSARMPFASGNFMATGFTDQRMRVYHSKWLDTSYMMPGFEFFRSFGVVRDSTLTATAFVPNRVIGARTVADGTYTPISGTSRISVLAWNQNRCYSALRDSLTIRTDTTPHTDHRGPGITVLANGRRIYDGDVLPATFDLSAQISDSSGILISPVTQFSPSLYYSFIVPENTTPPERVSATDAFLYDVGTHTTGRFTREVTLPAPEDTLFVFAADNYLNIGTQRIYVQVRPDSGVKIQQPLVYPNPLARSGYFTFALNLPATVTVRIFSLSGRLLRGLPGTSCNLGFNQIPWDGCDGKGVLLPNGVYLYRIEAQTFGQNSGARESHSDQAFEKFIVKR